MAIILAVAAPVEAFAAGAPGAAARDTGGLMESGSRYFARGQFERAVSAWTAAHRRFTEIGDRAGTISSLARRAEAYQSLGHYAKSIADLTAAIELAKRAGAAATIARLQNSLGNAYFLAGVPVRAEAEFAACLKYARLNGDDRLTAEALNNLGNLLVSVRRTDEAVGTFETSVRLATETGHRALAASALLNAARLSLDTGAYDRSEQLLRRAVASFERLPDSSHKAFGLISAGRLLGRLGERLQETSPARQAAIYAAFDEARRIAQTIGDERSKSYAYGFLGRLYESRGRLAEAVQLTRQALFSAQGVAAPEIVYRWQWQMGRLYRARGDTRRALESYRQAVASLRSMRSDLIVGTGAGRSTFQDIVKPVLSQLVDLLLLESRAAGEPRVVQARLIEARETVELLKTAELEDYFQDQCVATLQAKVKSVDQLAERTAALYPVLLADRTELLLSLPEGMVQVTVPVGADEVTAEIRDLRRKLEIRTTREFLLPAQKLHEWLIEPLAGRLARAAVDTIVFIPSGPLHTIPISALHDGSRFLVERYAVAVAPGLTLLDPRPLEQKEIDLLASGLTESVQGFSPLPFVDAELRSVQKLLGGRLLKDEAFKTENIRRALDSSPYSVVHIASHAQFQGNAKDSFLLTFDGKLSMDGLERFVKLSRFRDKPVGLLTLSACATAAGDDRAALGLAGVAIKAGARSALASLWFINDEATSLLVSKFYELLKNRSGSKAKALQQAQLALIADPRYRHPIYWSAFLLIGNWL